MNLPRKPGDSNAMRSVRLAGRACALHRAGPGRRRPGTHATDPRSVLTVSAAIVRDNSWADGSPQYASRILAWSDGPEDGPDAMAVRIGLNSRRSDSRSAAVRRESRSLARDHVQALAQFDFVLDLAEEPRAVAASSRRSRTRPNARETIGERPFKLRASIDSTAARSQPGESSRRGRRFCQTIWGSKGSSCSEDRTSRRMGMGSIPASLLAAIATWRRTSGESSRARATHLSRIAGSTCALVARGPHAPGPDRRDRDRRGVGRGTPDRAGRTRRASTGRASSRVSRSGRRGPSLESWPARGVGALGEEPLGDVAVVDVRASQQAINSSSPAFARSKPVRRASRRSGRGRAGP